MGFLLTMLFYGTMLSCGEWSIIDRDSEVIPSLFVTEQLVQEPPGQLDILFVVDGTGSMAEEQGLLAAQAERLLETLGASPKVAWQIGVTSMNSAEAGKLRGIPWILTPDQEDPALLLASMLQVGSSQLPPSEGMSCALLALQNEENTGFRRPDAALQIVFLSDSDDQSSTLPPNSADSGGTSSILDALVAELALQEQVSGMPARVSAIVGDLPSGCEDALPGTTYAEAVSRTSGTLQSICAPDFSSIATALAESALSQNTEFVLQGVPDLSQLDVVRVLVQAPGDSETSVVTDWQIIEVSGSFYLRLGVAPAPWSVITITYPLAS